jgi:MFS family permease
MPQLLPERFRPLFSATVIVSALGYFVDIYDLLLFSIVRVPSLQALGLKGQRLLDDGILLLDVQMIGLLLGGILWGVLGDKRGRRSVLFGSILLYSVANFANAFIIELAALLPGGVTPFQLYVVLRFLAGIGLAGELGAAVTLVSESLPKDLRGYGTAIVAGVGVSGAVVAATVGKYFSWQVAYMTGGILGFLLLATRATLLESRMFQALEAQEVSRGDFFALFTNGDRFRRFFCSILIGVPLWFAIGILITLSPELSRELGIPGITAGESIKYAYAGLVVGDLASGLLSQYFRSRRRVVFAFQTLTLLLTFVYVGSRGASPTYFYGLCFCIGIAAGYWAVFITIAAEQFGTNLRATVATSAPNFVRASVVPLTLVLQWLTHHTALGLLYSALAVGIGCTLLAYLALALLEESHGKALDFVEAT